MALNVRAGDGRLVYGAECSWICFRSRLMIRSVCERQRSRFQVSSDGSVTLAAARRLRPKAAIPPDPREIRSESPILISSIRVGFVLSISRGGFSAIWPDHLAGFSGVRTLPLPGSSVAFSGRNCPWSDHPGASTPHPTCGANKTAMASPIPYAVG